MWGGSGNDLLQGNDGNDNLIGGSGNDRIFGGRGDDNLWGNSGNDLLVGERGNDCVDAGSGNNHVDDTEDDFVVIDDGPIIYPYAQNNNSDSSFNPFDPLGLLNGGSSFLQNLISPK
jgi:Ca2+-binding RTX toxin-like protein